VDDNESVEDDQESEEKGELAKVYLEESAEGKESDDENQAEEPQEMKKRKRKQDKDPLARRKGKKGRNELVTTSSFFSDL